MELEIKHLTPYLPYGVKVSNNTHPDDVNFVIGLRVKLILLNKIANMLMVILKIAKYYFAHYQT